LSAAKNESHFRRVTIRDVAAKAGVSANAVSKVLNATKSNTKVSEVTRTRILESAAELGYQPNGLARSLQRRRTDIIGLYFEGYVNTSSPFVSAIIRGAETACQDRDQSLLIISRREGQPVAEVYSKLVGGVLDGVALPSSASPELFDLLRGGRLPAVVYPSGYAGFPSVELDEAQGARLVMAHLQAKGHTKVLYLSRPERRGRRDPSFEAAASSAAMELHVHHAADQQGRPAGETEALLRGPARPSGLICWNDEYAYRMLDLCDSWGLRVPEDIAIVGFDGEAAFPRPHRVVTTVFANWSQLAATTVSLLVELRDGREVPPLTSLPVELHPGDTT